MAAFQQPLRNAVVGVRTGTAGLALDLKVAKTFATAALLFATAQSAHTAIYDAKFSGTLRRKSTTVCRQTAQ